MPQKKRDKKLNSQDKKLIEEIVRVDHAGEHGATQIYRGQLAIFNKNTDFGKEILEIYCKAPETNGSCDLLVTLVQEHHAWFSQDGFEAFDKTEIKIS